MEILSPKRLYAIGEPGESIKFGVSTNPSGRLAFVQCSSHLKLQILGESQLIDYRDAYKLEKRVHRALWQFHQRGEWFKSCPKTLAFARLITDSDCARIWDLTEGWLADEAVAYMGGKMRKVADVRASRIPRHIDTYFRRKPLKCS